MIQCKNNTDKEKLSDETAIIKKDGSVLTPVNNSFRLNLFKLQRVLIKDDDKNSIIDLCKDYLGIDISEETEFFNIGNLERKYDLLSSYSYEGTKDEENKYDSIMMLEYNLHRVQMLDWYVTTFDGLLFIPLVIENKQAPHHRMYSSVEELLYICRYYPSISIFIPDFSSTVKYSS